MAMAGDQGLRPDSLSVGSMFTRKKTMYAPRARVHLHQASNPVESQLLYSCE